MKLKSFEMLLLFDFYGELLTDKQKQLFDLYYNEDMSLFEIAENTGITRQAVRDSIVRAENILCKTEEKLALVARYSGIQAKAEKICSSLNDISQINNCCYKNQDISAAVKTALELAESIAEKVD